MADAYDFDLFTIGAGSGGVRASRVASAHGAKVAIAEEYRVGGTCVIRGCVPKKMLVYGAHFAEDLEDAKAFGWEIENATFDWVRLRDNVMRDIDRLNGLYTETLENHDVTIFTQRAELTGPHEVTLADGQVFTAKHILIATGATPLVPKFPGSEHGITSNEAFHLDAVPKRALIVGAGYIANEFAGIFHQFGGQVTIINRSDTLLRGYDHSLRDRLLNISMAKGIQFRFNTTISSITKQDDGSMKVAFDGSDDMDVDCVLFATGRSPNTHGLGLDVAGVETGRKRRSGRKRPFANQRRTYLCGGRCNRSGAAYPGSHS